MSTRIRTLLVILSVSLNVAFVVAWGMKTVVTTAHAARHERQKCNMDSCRVWCPLHRALGTTETQWHTLEPMQRKFQTASQQLADSADVLRSQLADLLAPAVVNPAAVDAKQSEILAVQQKMQTLVVMHLLEEKQLLTPEQQTRLFAMMRDHGGCAGHGTMMGGASGGADCPKNKTRNE
jgi:Spy/CpxP family protein refolding chaperone